MNCLLRLSVVVAMLGVFSSCQQEEGSGATEAVMADSTATTEGAEAVPAIPVVTLNYTQREGKRLYDHYCAICHGGTGQGDGFNAYNLNPKPKDMTQKSYLDAVTDQWLVEVISQGGRGVKRSVLMPSYENTLDRSQIEAIVSYLRTLAQSE